MTSVDDYQQRASERQACRQMFRLATYIQYDLSQGTSLDPMQYPAKLKTALGLTAPEDDFTGITCHEIPLAKQYLNLKGLAFYLYDEKTKQRVLADGSVYWGDFED